MKIFTIGPGRWGSFIAYYLDSIGHELTLYGRDSSEKMRELIKTRRNGNITLSEKTKLTTSLSDAVGCELIVISIASQALRSLLKELKEINIADTPLVLCMKGIEIESGLRLTEIVKEVLGKDTRVAVWLGPGHVEEFTRGRPNCMVIDSEDDELKHKLVDEFTSALIRFYYGTDLIGNEIGAAAKNVIGIAAGILDGLSLTSLKGALMARAPREISRLVGAMSGDPVSAYGLCHLGDYEATVFSKYSHNRAYGESLVNKSEFSSLAEGYYTVKALINLAARYSVELPICEAVYNVIYKNSDIKSEIEKLFKRSVKYEFD